MRLFLTLLAALTFTLQPCGARADDAEDRAKALVASFIDECVTARAGATGPALRRNEGVAASLRKAVDIPGVAELVLGRWWKKMSGDQKARFVGLFDRYLIATFDFEDITPQVAYLGFDRESEAVVVRTLIADTVGGTPTHFDWITNTTSAPHIIDVRVDDQSVAKTVSADFSAVLRRNGGDIEGFLQMLEAKIEAMARG